MSCEAEKDALEAATRRARDLEIEVKLAERKAKGGLLTAGGACVGEVLGGFLLGGPIGAIGGSFACGGGLLAADSVVGDLEAARQNHENAKDDMADAMLEFVKCGFRRDAEPAGP